MEEIRTISFEDREYPQVLKKIANPPKSLFIKGKLYPKEKCFAIVGTRKCTGYGKEIAKELAYDLAQAGFTIVSGFAFGIDTAAHLGALEAEKRTIAVLGTGLDEQSIYPQRNRNLVREILEKGGALISEYPPGTPGSKFTFPQRNRIIAGISLGILVVEAQGKSGALITAHWAKQQGKKIFAVPGNINALTSKGPHLLIKEGAKLVETVEDILKEFDLPSKKERKRKPIEEGREEERKILMIISEGPSPIDKIIEKTKFPPSLVISTLTILEAQGKIKNLGGNIYILS